MTEKSFKKPQSLANLIVRLFFVGYSFLTLAIITQSYHFSVNSINSEISRNLDQTSRLLQNIIDYKLAALKSSQEANVNSQELQNHLINKDLTAIDDLFFALEENDAANSPDFRFISNGEELIWHDGASFFHGIDDNLIKELILEQNNNREWHYVQKNSLLNTVDLLIRQTPVVNRETGKVIGYLSIAIVLNNNLSLIDEFRRASNVESVFLVNGANIVATNLSIDTAEYAYVKEMLTTTKSKSLDNNYLVNVSAFNVNETESYIQFLTLEKNDNIELLRDKFIWSVVASLFAAILLLLLTRRHIKSRIVDSLNTLMSYTRSATERREFKAFGGTPISEFNQIGATLQATLSTLIEKERSLDDLFKIALSPTIVWDADCSIKRINPAAKSQFNYQEHSSTQSAEFELFSTAMRPLLESALTGETIRGAHTQYGETVYNWNLAPLIIDSQVIAIIGQAQDITALIEAERQSRRAQLAAEASANAKSDFLAKMSHEIRTPLNGILGIAQILKGSLKNTQHLDKVETLYQSGEHLLTVLNDILDFSRIEQGKFTLEFNNMALKEITKPIIDVYQPLCDEKDILFHIDCKVEANTVFYSDKSRIIQILFNLLSNAVKFTHQGEISFSVWKENKLCYFNVRDTGIGIDEDTLPKLFEPFTQAEPSTTRKYGGSGLGLSIVKSLVELLEGELKIESQFGIGTSITFSLPMKEVAQSIPIERAIETVKPVAVPHNINVLLVEDNKTNAFVAKVFCKKFGISVDWVENGEEALNMLSDKAFDLILMDNHMPVMGGIETTRRIREELNITTPIYACTADAFEEAHNDFMAAGANYVIVKPIREQNFVAALDHFKQLKISNT
ncbi:LuxQ periplasmic sensor domain-containing protein [Thaumasiovibrio subtropicus]|uniref:LuxQ periplasmic sensor domain-containing protein n=1 Tax=Thaumasiovibrio subtropicus TaxID=1891207 RepID=UPI000B35E48C|nr:LuxQ periplasmic sensor domain-containing protein [Thaumasiovibrio subtropicus]